MSLVETLPEVLKEALKREDLDPGIAVATDLTLEGRFGEEWLVITDRRLRVYPPEGTPPVPRLELPLDKRAIKR